MWPQSVWLLRCPVSPHGVGFRPAAHLASSLSSPAYTLPALRLTAALLHESGAHALRVSRLG